MPYNEAGQWRETPLRTAPGFVTKADRAIAEVGVLRAYLDQIERDLARGEWDAAATGQRAAVRHWDELQILLP